MQILNSYVENDILSKNAMLKTADWVLTPCRRAFNGKSIQLTQSAVGTPSWEENSDGASTPFKRVLWAILAAATSPLAAIAAFFKCMTSPSIGVSKIPCVMGNCYSLVKDLQEVTNAVAPLKKAGLSGRVQVCLALTKEQQALSKAEAETSIKQSLALANLCFFCKHDKGNSDRC